MNFSNFFNSLLTILNEMSPYILLGFLLAGLMQVFLCGKTMSRHLGGNNVGSVVKAALLGIPLPLCSCGVLPTAIGLRRGGASKGATVSFLIATPQTGVDSIAATYSLLGLPFALLRPVAALVGAVFGGIIALDGKSTQDPQPAISTPQEENPYAGLSLPAKLLASVKYGFVDMVASVGRWLVIGLVVAALITVLLPDDFLASLSDRPLLAMLAVVVVAIPMYVCATGSIPIALSLMLKGLSPGAAFVLLMAGPAANFASVLVLGRTLGRRSTALYVGSVVVTSVAFGLLIDTVLPREWFIPDGMLSQACHNHAEGGFANIFSWLCSGLLIGLLAYSFIAQRKHTHDHNHIHIDEMTREYTIKGMNCPHCQAAVSKAIASVAGVTSVSVELSTGTAIVEGTAEDDPVCRAVHDAGFSAEPKRAAL